MANTERIEDIISEKAFKQLEKLLADLGIAQQKFVDTAKAAEELNNAVGKSKTFKDFGDNSEKAAKAMVAVTAEQEKFIKKTEQVAKAEDQVVKSTKARIAATIQDKKALEQISGTLDQNIKLQVRLKSELSQVKEQQKLLTKELTLSQKSKQAAAGRTAELAKREAELKAAIQQSNLDIRRSIKDQTAASGSSDQLAARLDRLRAAYRGLSQEERENVNIGGKLLTQINQLDEQVKQLDGRQGVYTRHVGDYGRAIADLNAKIVVLKNQYRQLTPEQQRNIQVGGVLLTQIKSTQLEVRKLTATMASHNAVVGGLRGAMASLIPTVRALMSAFGVVGGVFLFAQVLRNAFNEVRSFQKANAILAGALETTRDNVKALTDDAIRLGSSTAKTASEVTQLQIAYAKLGFTQEEILNLAEGTINGSIALNASLEETAELTGAVVNTFDDFSSTDAGIILDQLTSAANKSALSFKSLQTAIPIVAGAANAAGISFTELLALLGKLSDAGIDASMSATALRNIFIESASQGLKYDQILARIVGSSDKLTASTDEFGKRSAVSGTILAKQIGTIAEFSKELENAGGTAKRVADEQLNTLDGAITLLTSAWSGLILSIDQGDGVLGGVLVDAIKGVTNLLINTKKEFDAIKEGVLQISAGFAGLGNVIKAIPSITLNALRSLKELSSIDINFLDPASTASSINAAFNKVRSTLNANFEGLKNAYKMGYYEVIAEARKANSASGIATGGGTGGTATTPPAGTKELTKEELNALEKAKKEQEKKRIAIAKAAIGIQKLQYEEQSAILEQTIDDEKATFDQRLDALQDFLKYQKAIIDADRRIDLLDADLSNEGKQEIQAEADKKLTELKIKGAEESKKILKDQLANEDELRVEAQERALAIIEAGRTEEITALNERFRNGEIREEEYQLERLKLERKYTQEYISAEIKAAQDIIDIYKERGLSTAEAEKNLAALKLKYSQEATDAQIEDMQRLEEQEQLLADRRRELSQEVFEFGLALFTSNIDREKNRLQEQLDAIEIKKGHEIEAIEASVAGEEEKAARIRIVEAQTQLEREKIDRKQRQLDEEKARFDRLAQIAGIIGNTARGVTSALAMFPPNIPLSILIGAIGAAQIGQVLATPIPKYATGTDSSPEGWAIVGEKGPEGRIEPSGSFSMTPGTSTLTWTKKGTKIIPHEDMKRIAAGAILRDTVQFTGGSSLDTRPLIAAQERSTKQMVKALSRPEHKTVVTGSGIRYFVRKGSSWKEYIGRSF